MDFLEKLQSADETTKKRWLVASTSVIMVVVVALWLAYFNTLLTSFTPTPPPEVINEEAGFTFLETLGNGAAVVYQSVGDAIGRAVSFITAPRSYLITPEG